MVNQIKGVVLATIAVVLILWCQRPVTATLPPTRIHPLPPSLAKWHDPSQSGDYFQQIQRTQPEYLVWSKFPIKIYLQPTPITQVGRARIWERLIVQAIQEWGKYLPLEQVAQRQNADIEILRVAPKLRFPLRQRAQFAETRFDLYTQSAPQHAKGLLYHRCIISIPDRQADQALLAAARHELGHALGIWGHSSQASDVLYFSQVRYPPPISARDVNTLKRVYQQPTRLGWAVEESR